MEGSNYYAQGEGTDGNKQPVYVVVQPQQVQPYTGGTSGFNQGPPQPGPYGHPHPPPPGGPHHPPHYYGGPVDDPSSVWCFLVLGLFFPICCLIGLCATNPNQGPRTASAYNVLKIVTIIYWIIILIYLIVIAGQT